MGTAVSIEQEIYHKERVFKLFRLGFRPAIVNIESPLPINEITKIRKELFPNSRPPSGALQSGFSIVKTPEIVKATSLFVAQLIDVMGPAALDSTSPEMIATSLERAKTIWITSGLRNFPIDVTQAWIIARDLRSNEAWFKACHSCQNPYIIVNEQKIPTDCPWCSESKRTRKPKKSKSESSKSKIDDDEDDFDDEFYDEGHETDDLFDDID